jgi:hypothetical protein
MVLLRTVEIEQRRARLALSKDRRREGKIIGPFERHDGGRRRPEVPADPILGREHLSLGKVGSVISCRRLGSPEDTCVPIRSRSKWIFAAD